MADQADLGFPDAPRSELERTIEELIERAQTVLATQGRLRSLVRANSLVVEELDVAQVLLRIVEAAVELVDARYGALGVIAPDGSLEQFIHVGMPEEEAARIAHLPEGHGLLGAVVDQAERIRLPHIAEDPRSAGFPANHPHMDSFLGVPIRIRDEVFGNLYLTERSGGAFSAEDEELIAALAATAAIAIDNARLFDETRRRQRWSAALAEVTSTLLSGTGDMLAVIADRVGSVVDADLVCVIVPSGPGRLRVQLARGQAADDVEGREYDAAGTLAGRALEQGTIVAVETETVPSQDWQPVLGPSIALPLAAAGVSLGVLTLSRRPGSARFAPADLEMAAEFAAQAGVAIELVRGREDRQRLELVGERSRIARDLHDHVIQRLFAAGLGLHSLADGSPALAPELLRHVDAIDTAIADIRTAVFTLAHGASAATTRQRVLDIANELSPALGFSPRVVFSGPIDLLVQGELADDVGAVVREGLSNVLRHAAATAATVEVHVDDERVSAVVADDGRGISPDVERRSGTGNLADRARARGGEFTIEPAGEAGTRIEWSIPLPREETT